MRRPLAPLLLLLAAPAARADLKLTVTLRLANTGVKDLTPDAVKDDPKRAAQLQKGLDASPDIALLMGRPITVVEWFRGDRRRTDLGTRSYLASRGSDRILVLDHRRRTVAQAQDDAPRGPNPPDPPALRDTGRTRIVAGRATREYALDLTAADGTPLTMSLWVAADLPATAASAGPLDRRIPQGARAALGRVKGVALRFEVKIPMEGGRLANLVEEATAVSTAPIPTATFDVPKGYRKAPAT